MQPGDLVKITRASIGAPKGTIGLITNVRMYRPDEPDHDSWPMYYVQRTNGPLRRYLARDLEIISASR